MYTVTTTRTVTWGRARSPRETGLQYVSLGELSRALRGGRPVGMQTVTHRRCRTWVGAWAWTWWARLSGASATITRGDIRARQDQVWRAIAGLPAGDA